jgi:hypothetical protein
MYVYELLTILLSLDYQKKSPQLLRVSDLAFLSRALLARLVEAIMSSPSLICGQKIWLIAELARIQ